MASTLSTNDDRPKPSFVENGTYCRIWYNRIHVSFKRRHVKGRKNLVWAPDRKHEARFGVEGDYSVQIIYSPSPNSPDPKEGQDSLKTNYNIN